MKILHVINNLATGGAEKLILDTIPLMNKKGYQVDLLVIDGTDYPYLSKLKGENCCVIYSLSSKNLYNPFNLFKIIPYLRKYDLLHVHLFPVQYWVVFAKLFSFSKVRIIFTEHNTTNSRMNNIFFKYFEKVVYKLYDKIVCISVEIKDILIEYCKLNPVKFIVVENGIDLNQFNSAIPKNHSEIHNNILDSDKLIIQVAGFRAQKDQSTTVKSLSYLPSNVKLLLVGDGEFRGDLEKLVKVLKLEERVFFLGIRLDVPILMKSADIVVVSSHWEGMPLSVIEGMAVNKPVVASNVPGVFQLVEGVGVLFEKGNEIELASKIKELLNDKDYCNKVATAGYERSKQYDINVMVDKEIELYKELLK